MDLERPGSRRVCIEVGDDQKGNGHCPLRRRRHLVGPPSSLSALLTLLTYHAPTSAARPPLRSAAARSLLTHRPQHAAASRPRQGGEMGSTQLRKRASIV